MITKALVRQFAKEVGYPSALCDIDPRAQAFAQRAAAHGAAQRNQRIAELEAAIQAEGLAYEAHYEGALDRITELESALAQMTEQRDLMQQEIYTLNRLLKIAHDGQQHKIHQESNP